jgi:hypothetical protein
MNLSDFPRPLNDTGLGIHLSASNVHPLGERESDYIWWISEIKAMGFTWVKLLVGGGNAVEIARLLQNNGLMVIVRFYQHEQWPDALLDHQPQLAQYVRDYVAAGVRYFETGNEQNLKPEWNGGEGNTASWDIGAQPDRICEAWVRDAKIVLDNGGYPLYPALSPGGHYNDVDFFRASCAWLAQKGYRDLLQRGCCIGIHNGTLNHPLDYPGDPVNQLGIPVSEEEYNQHVWAGSRDFVNAERVRGKNPGQTLLSVNNEGKDTGGSNCWDKFKAYRDIFFNTFGFEIPILGTEGGVWVGTRINDNYGPRIYDPRYPAISKEMQKDWTLEIARKMMAGGYPPYYFCTGFWIISNHDMGNTYAGFENDAWYSAGLWDGGRLPVVHAMKDLPKQLRPVTVVNTKLTDTQIAAITREQGFKDENWTISVAVALAESGGNAEAIGYNKDANGQVWSRDFGLFQINDYTWMTILKQQGIWFTDESWKNPVLNAKAAFYISGGTNWNPWVTYTTGAYLSYMDRARAVTSTCAIPEKELRNYAYYQCLKVPFNPDAALQKKGLEMALVPLTDEVQGTISCNPIIGQVFIGASGLYLLWCVVGDYGNVNVFRLDE